MTADVYWIDFPVIGFARGHHSKWAILAVNLLFGWTFIGWAVALIWSLTGVRK